MTIREVITDIDSLKSNQYTDAQKIKWLNNLDRKIYQELFLTHEVPEIEFDGYSESTDFDTELLINENYSEVYIYYLMSQIDFFNNETARYTNDMLMFNSAYSEYCRWFNRQYKPKNHGNYKVI